MPAHPPWHVFPQLPIEVVGLQVPEGLVLQPLLHVSVHLLHHLVHGPVGGHDALVALRVHQDEVAVLLCGGPVQANLGKGITFILLGSAICNTVQPKP